MIVEKSQKLVELSQHKKSLQTFAGHLQTIQTRQKQITDAIAIIQPLVEALKAFRKRGINNIDLTQKVEPILSLVINASDNLQNNPDWILEPKNFKRNILMSQLVHLKTLLEDQLSQSWKNYYDEQMPLTNNEILNVLVRVEDFKETVRQIQNLERDLKNVIYPKNNAEFEKCELKIERFKHFWYSLNSDDFPEAILHFLQAASDQGSSLNLLTPEVQNWINQNGISDSFKIRLT